MITLLIGHRGTGKSRLLERVAHYFKEAGRPFTALDLDHSIEEGEGLPLNTLFETRGEAAFRVLEKTYLAKLIERHRGSENLFISSGAGYEGPPPDGVRCLWVRRSSDSLGRVFLDRPRLDPHKGPIEEFLGRFNERQKRYRQWAEDILTIPEGLTFANEWERDFFLDGLTDVGGVLTLPPELFQAEGRFRRHVSRRMKWGVRFELRDDLLGPEELKLALSVIPHDRVLLSLRKSASQKGAITSLKQGALWDWPAEWPLPTTLRPSILSLHEREGRGSVLEAGRRLERLASTKDRRMLLKLAVDIRDFDELLEGHRWAMEKPETRSFLPRSTDGRWAWYRLLNKGRFKINFLREGEGSAPDQPYLMDWLRTPKEISRFAAILGNPVSHSHTPAEQLEFFSAREMPVFAIALTEDEWDNGALEILRTLGLEAAAVTSPLKLHAGRSAKLKTPEAERYESVNTLQWKAKEQAWKGHNTDIFGLQALFESVRPTDKIAVWGGHGTLPLLEESLPQACFYSARSGKPREGSRVPEGFAPDTLVWSIGRSRQEEDRTPWPPSAWSPNVVIDLNYGEDSPGREYALQTGARYISGLAMFKAQAKRQRDFWGED
ncbi:MAG: shikimate synthase [Oligoflexia bacterium]|nr:shikimate synthase [Oligoflexia bacterium]